MKASCMYFSLWGKVSVEGSQGWLIIALWKHVIITFLVDCVVGGERLKLNYCMSFHFSSLKALHDFDIKLTMNISLWPQRSLLTFILFVCFNKTTNYVWPFLAKSQLYSASPIISISSLSGLASNETKNSITVQYQIHVAWENVHK